MSSVSIDSLLKGIGCNMIAASPEGMTFEDCLTDLSLSLLQDPKALALAIGAVKANAQVIQPEILLNIIRNRKCDFNVIGALLLKTKDHRFSKEIEFCREQKFASEKPAKILSLALKIGQTEADKEFASFGVAISQLEPVDPKKIAII